MPRRARSHTLRLWKVWPCTGDRALGLTSLRCTTRVIAGKWRVYILKCGSDPPNAGHLRDMLHNYIHVQCMYIHVYTGVCILHVHHVLILTGTKNVARELKKVSVGRATAKGKTWFPEISDNSMCNFLPVLHVYTCIINSGKSTITHLYWCMKMVTQMN